MYQYFSHPQTAHVHTHFDGCIAKLSFCTQKVGGGNHVRVRHSSIGATETFLTDAFDVYASFECSYFIYILIAMLLAYHFRCPFAVSGLCVCASQWVKFSRIIFRGSCASDSGSHFKDDPFLLKSQSLSIYSTYIYVKWPNRIILSRTFFGPHSHLPVSHISRETNIVNEMAMQAKLTSGILESGVERYNKQKQRKNRFSCTNF